MQLTRRRFLFVSASMMVAGCTRGGRSEKNAVLTWGGPDVRDGCFRKPRAVAIQDGEVYVVDTTGRVQVFSPDGQFLRKWSTPAYQNGTPTAIAFAVDGQVLIPDTHYSQILKYTRDGQLLEQWGQYGTGPNEFVYPTDIVQSPDGTYFISEYGMEAERIHVFDAEERFLRQWGSLGEAPGQLNRPTAIDLDAQGVVYVADSANHRVQCFDQSGQLLRGFGEAGTGPGQLKFPYAMTLAPDGSVLVCEYGNNRISRFHASGEFVASFGGPGREPGQFNEPRGVAVSPDGLVFVADTGNHRIQRFRLEVLS